jgi:D-alanyl-D-alanine carboxypeptidase
MTRTLLSATLLGCAVLAVACSGDGGSSGHSDGGGDRGFGNSGSDSGGAEAGGSHADAGTSASGGGERDSAGANAGGDGASAANGGTSPGGQGGAGLDGGGQGGAPADPACVALGEKLQAAVDTHYFGGTPQTVGGASLAVISGNCRWLGAVGEAHTGIAMTPDHLFRVASVTKTFVATTLLSLIEDGELDLDDTVDDWVSGVPKGDLITVRMLLDHTSGIYNYVTDSTFWNQALAEPNVAVTPQSLVDVATGHAESFAPGAGWSYTNTGFILAGMVIEAVTNSTAATVLRERAFEPAGLENTFFASEDSVPSLLATGFGDTGEDVTNAVHPSVNWTAGAVVATAGDLADWAQALYGGHILSSASMDEMTTPVATGGAGLSYGLGAFLYDKSKLGNIGPGIGHNGKLPGYSTDMTYMREDGSVIVQIGNSNTGKNFLGVLLVTLYAP